MQSYTHKVHLNDKNFKRNHLTKATSWRSIYLPHGSVLQTITVEVALSGQGVINYTASSQLAPGPPE